MTADVPLRVEAGSTFTVTVKEVGVAVPPAESAPPARWASLLATWTEPSRISLGSPESPVSWPQRIDLTVTGEPGDVVLFGLLAAGPQTGTPSIDGLFCSTARSEQHGLFASIPIVEPD